MADGAEMDWKAGKITECVSLDTAIAGLRAGTLAVGTSVDLGDGLIAEFGAAEDAAGLLARLEAHARLIDIALGEAQETPRAPATVSIDSHAKALLDAIKNAR
ncbi:MAG: hypothetical protein AAFR33_09360 [Pseudomonadota bacterium]